MAGALCNELIRKKDRGWKTGKPLAEFRATRCYDDIAADRLPAEPVKYLPPVDKVTVPDS